MLAELIYSADSPPCIIGTFLPLHLLEFNQPQILPSVSLLTVLQLKLLDYSPLTFRLNSKT